MSRAWRSSRFFFDRRERDNPARFSCQSFHHFLSDVHAGVIFKVTKALNLMPPVPYLPVSSPHVFTIALTRFEYTFLGVYLAREAVDLADALDARSGGR